MTKLHFILCDFGERLGTTWVERDPSEMDRAATIRDIATGQVEDVLQVLEVDPAAGTSRDVTAEIMAAAFEPEDEPVGRPSAYDLARDLDEAYAA